MVEGLYIDLKHPKEKVILSSMPDVVSFMVSNKTKKEYEISVYVRFYFSNDGLSWRIPTTRKWGSSRHTSKPGEYVLWSTGIFMPKTEFEKYHFMKVEAKVHIYLKGDKIDEFMVKRVVEHVDWLPPKKPKSNYIPYDSIQAAVVKGLTRREICHEIDFNKYLIEVTETVKKVNDKIQSAWLVVDVSIPNMKVEMGWPELCTEPKCVVKRWLSGGELQRLTIDGIKYTVRMPASIIIFHQMGFVEYGGTAMSRKEMLKHLAFLGYIGSIVEDIVTKAKEDKQIKEESESESEEDKKEGVSKSWMIAAVLAVVLLGIAFWRWK